MKKDSPIRLLPGYISFSFPVQIGLYPGNKQAECQGAKKYPIIPIGISDFSKSVVKLLESAAKTALYEILHPNK